MFYAIEQGFWVILEKHVTTWAEFGVQILYPFADWNLVPIEDRSRKHCEFPAAGFALVHLYAITG
jgi:hypothetical protein